MISKMSLSAAILAVGLIAGPAIAQQPGAQGAPTLAQWNAARSALLQAKQRTAQARQAWQQAEQAEGQAQGSFDNVNNGLLNALSGTPSRLPAVPGGQATPVPQALNNTTAIIGGQQPSTAFTAGQFGYVAPPSQGAPAISSQMGAPPIGQPTPPTLPTPPRP
ncbi:MAG TPA: hypothetical protein VGO34_00820 [Alphaproteobacteria bacterium]|jgi:hypothetical protein